MGRHGPHTIAFPALCTIMLLVSSTSLGWPDANCHDDPDSRKQEPESGRVVQLSTMERNVAGIRVETLALKPITGELTVRDEIAYGPYRTSFIASDIDAQIKQRHAKPGDHVRQGQLLVSLLGPKMTAREREANPVNFNLRAPHDGVILASDFEAGQWVQAGQPLFKLMDENALRINLMFPPKLLEDFIIGYQATILRDDLRLTANVNPEPYKTNEVTGMALVRLDLSNQDQALHPGQFVDVQLQLSTRKPVTAVADTALAGSADEEWAIFIEESCNRFRRTKVKRVKTLFGRSIIEGVEVGRRIVVEGAFILTHELLKEGVTGTSAETDHGEKAHGNRSKTSLDRSDVTHLHPEPNKIQNGEK
jgi:multidrug efflux pump subunit AcrA (membrane-fusion protein)